MFSSTGDSTVQLTAIENPGTEFRCQNNCTSSLVRMNPSAIPELFSELITLEVIMRFPWPDDG
jgi:hypothetical protein